MQKFQVKSIENIKHAYLNFKHKYSFKEGDIQIIVITRNKYNYNFKPLLELDFDDITRDYKPIGTKQVNKKHVEKIIEKLPEIERASLVFVCCDAGISRSPAVAKALAHYLLDIRSFNYLAYRYPFANSEVFEFVLLGLRENDRNNRIKV